MSAVGELIAFESGNMTMKEEVELFSKLLKSGMVWKLQGFYGRIANSFIENKILSKDGRIMRYPDDKE